VLIPTVTGHALPLKDAGSVLVKPPGRSPFLGIVPCQLPNRGTLVCVDTASCVALSKRAAIKLPLPHGPLSVV
jgi:hypothetical protein